MVPDRLAAAALACLGAGVGCVGEPCPDIALREGEWRVESTEARVVPDGVDDAVVHVTFRPPGRDLSIDYASGSEMISVEGRMWSIYTTGDGDCATGWAEMQNWSVGGVGLDDDRPIHGLFWSELQYACDVGEETFTLSGVHCFDLEQVPEAPRVVLAWSGG